MVVGGQADLPEIVAAGHPAGRLACGLDCRKQQSNQDPNNCDNHQKLYDRKTISSEPSLLHFPLLILEILAILRCQVSLST